MKILTYGSSQWCAGRVTVNKVIDRQKVRLMVNKLTMTFDQLTKVTIIGNDLSASFGMVCTMARTTSTIYHVMHSFILHKT